MAIQCTRLHAPRLACFVLFSAMLASAQATPGTDYSGMYSFLRDGEFVQVTVEDRGRVTGFVSRYGDSESDRGVFSGPFFQVGETRGQSIYLYHRDGAWCMVRISGDGRAGRGQEPGRRSVLRVEGNSHREHNRRSEENFFPLARGGAERLPAGCVSSADGKEVGRLFLSTIDYRSLIDVFD